MPVVVVANPKGGVGKSTLSTNIAGYFASQGHPVILGDTDRQQSARLWLGLRPPAARPIGSWDATSDVISRPPKGTTLVFTSGGTITALLHLLTGVPAERAFELNWQIVNTSLSRLTFRGDEATLASFNSRVHLELLKTPELITYR